MATGEKAPGAFKTIGELSPELGVAQHILRYWETKFPQLRPMQRAGNRRYYRPADVELARTHPSSAQRVRAIPSAACKSCFASKDGPGQSKPLPAARYSAVEPASCEPEFSQRRSTCAG